MQTETQPTVQKPVTLRTLVPRVDIYDHDGDVILVADVPGVSESDVDIQLEKNTLMLTARAEGLGIAWKRSFTLPKTVDGARVVAALKDGVLTLNLPRRAEDKARRIAVTVG